MAEERGAVLVLTAAQREALVYLVELGAIVVAHAAQAPGWPGAARARAQADEGRAPEILALLRAEPPPRAGQLSAEEHVRRGLDPDELLPETVLLTVDDGFLQRRLPPGIKLVIRDYDAGEALVGEGEEGEEAAVVYDEQGRPFVYDWPSLDKRLVVCYT